MQYIKSHHKVIACWFALIVSGLTIFQFLYGVFYNHVQIDLHTDHSVEMIASLSNIVLVVLLALGGLMVLRDKSEYMKVLLFAFGMCMYSYSAELGYAISSGVTVNIVYDTCVVAMSGIMGFVLYKSYLG